MYLEYDVAVELFDELGKVLGEKYIGGKKRQWASECPECRATYDQGQTGKAKKKLRASFGEFFSSPDGDGWGFHCLVCGFTTNLVNYAHLMGHGDIPESMGIRRDLRESAVAAPRKRPVMVRRNDDFKDYMLSLWKNSLSEIVDKAHRHERVYELWWEHKRVDRRIVDKWKLGVGPLPASKCQHDRLLVPVPDKTGKPVWIRGRRIDCDCDRPWSAAGGVSPSMDECPPFHPGWQKHLGPQAEQRPADDPPIVYIVENMVDAMLIAHHTTDSAMAIMSTTYSSARWLNHLKALFKANPRLTCCVALDAHGPGNGFVGVEQADKKFREVAAADYARVMKKLKGVEVEARPDRFLILWHAVRETDTGYIVAYADPDGVQRDTKYTRAFGQDWVDALNSDGIAAGLFGWNESEAEMDIGELWMMTGRAQFVDFPGGVNLK